jgi:2-amino-4-hydroxy-6-hydroxymethyldihydropteridine diphosphokinase
VDPVRVAIAMGSNLGDRRAHLQYAVDALKLALTGVAVSSYLETQPVGVCEEHGAFLNAVVVGRTLLPPRGLLDRLLEIEGERGRLRPYPMAPRKLDLDLILHGDTIAEEQGLRLPHPRFREREFVLVPLAEIAPDMVDPVTHLTIAALNTKIREGTRSSAKGDGAEHEDPR